MRALDRDDEDQIAVADDVEALDEHERRSLAALIVVFAANDWKSRMPTNAARRRCIRPRRSSGSLTHQTNGLAKRGAAPRDLIEVAARDRVVPRVKAVRHAL